MLAFNSSEKKKSDLILNFHRIKYKHQFCNIKYRRDCLSRGKILLNINNILTFTLFLLYQNWGKKIRNYYGVISRNSITLYGVIDFIIITPYYYEHFFNKHKKLIFFSNKFLSLSLSISTTN